MSRPGPAPSKAPSKALPEAQTRARPAPPRPVEVVLIEDDDGDAKAVRRALARSGFGPPPHRLRDGVEALEFLRGEAGARPPERYIILLDVNMPRMNGHEFLAELRADPALRRAVVFMLSTSRDSTDLERAYNHNVAAYILKEDTGPDYAQLLATFEAFGRVAQLPEMQAANAPGAPQT